MQTVIGEIVIGIGLLISGFGVYAILKLDRFYSRIVVTSKVETMGLITIILGAAIITGFSSFTVKLVIILVFEMLTLPVGSHAVARSAYANGFRAPEIIPPHDDPADASHSSPEDRPDA